MWWFLFFLITSWGGGWGRGKNKAGICDLQYLSLAFPAKVHLIGLELKFFAVVGILCGTAVSCFNYFRVIFGGGVGKNGSTIAVSCFNVPNRV